MYNRYVPQADGSFRKNRILEPQKAGATCQKQPQRQQLPPQQPSLCPTPQPERKPRPPQKHQSAEGFLRQLLPQGMDTGDLLIAVLLLLMAGDCQEDRNTALLTLALYLFL